MCKIFQYVLWRSSVESKQTYPMGSHAHEPLHDYTYIKNYDF